MSHSSFSDIFDPRSDEIEEIGTRHSSDDDVDSSSSQDALEERKSKLNTLFGFQPWDLPLSRAAAETIPPPDTGEATVYTFGNIMWPIVFGWWMALVYTVASILLFVSIVGIPYGKLCWGLAKYVFWPFGKYVVEKATQYNRNPGRETSALLVRPYAGPHSVRNVVGYAVWILVLVTLVLPMSALSLVLTWLSIVSVPMAKVNLAIIRLLFRRPLHHSIEPDYSTAQAHVIKICTHQAFNLFYFKYRIWGMNIIFVNLFPIVVLTVIESYAVPAQYALPHVAKFFVDLVCVVPITFYIGMAISSIAAQTNYMVGAFLHATFGSITELILYGAALRHGGFDTLVTFTVTGGLLSHMLLVPGLSMVIGGIRFKEQRFNTVATGVSSILLFISMIGVFTPTIFYHTYGNFHQQCQECHFPPWVADLNHSTPFNDTADSFLLPLSSLAAAVTTSLSDNSTINGTAPANVSEVFCRRCVYYQDDLDNDPMFVDAARPIMYFSAAVLPLAYLIGLLFTFRTHSHIFKDARRRTKGKKVVRVIPITASSQNDNNHKDRGDKQDQNQDIDTNGGSGNGNGNGVVDCGDAGAAAATTTPKPAQTVLVDDDEDEQQLESDDDADDGTLPEWSIPFSCIFMLVSTLLFALISENVVSELGPTVEALQMPQSFLGLTLIALVLSLTKIINAIKFALHDQISLAVQTGSASAIQISLIQMPVLVVMSAIINHGVVRNSFVLLFPMLTVFAVVFSVLTFNYIQTEGRTTYFKGAAMLIMYVIFIVSYWFVPKWALDPTQLGLLPNITAVSTAPARVLRFGGAV